MAGGRCRILVIEDDHESAEQIIESLVASGYESPPTATTDWAVHVLANML
jgi:DNA-binding response OmpR family regulator